jgi:hypothetical protein
MSPITKKLYFEGSRGSYGCHNSNVGLLLQINMKPAGIRAAVRLPVSLRPAPQTHSNHSRASTWEILN